MPFISGVGSFLFRFRVYHLPKSFVTISKNFRILVPCGNAGHTTKEQRSLELLNSMDNVLLEELGIRTTTNDNHSFNGTFYSALSDLTGQRWDAFFHGRNFQKNLQNLTNGKYPVQRLSTISRSFIKGHLPTQEEKDGSYKVVQINSINSDGTFDISQLLTTRYIYSLGQMLVKNDILVVITGATIGKIAYWDLLGEFYLGGDIVKFQVNKETDPRFIYYYLRSIPAQMQIKRYITGATNGHLSPNDIKRLLIPIPPIQIQERISQSIDKIIDLARSLQVEASTEFEQAKIEIERLILEKE